MRPGSGRRSRLRTLTAPATATMRDPVQALVLFFGAGGLMCAATLVVPAWPDQRPAVVAGVALAAVATSIVLLVTARSIREPVRHVLVGFGSLLIGLAMIGGGGGTASATYAVFYVLVAVYAFLFFTVRRAGAHVAFAASVQVSALVVLHEGGAAPAQIIVSMGTALTVGAVVGSLVARTRNLARTDMLTGLPNRLMLRQQLGEALAKAADSGEPLGVLLLDLDRFKEINDTLGHRFGDQLLRQIGPRLHHVLRPQDTIARLGGDEFAVLLPAGGTSSASPDTIFQTIPERIRKALADPFVLDGVSLSVEASAGLAVFPTHGSTAETLLHHADMAMYVAKKSYSGYAVYDSSLEEQNPRRLTLLSQLRAAIYSDQLLMHYQPVIDMGTARPVGVEALVRWQHPREGLLMPGEFLPLAESSGLIHELTIHVLTRSLAQCRQWLDDGRRLHMSVNLSARSLIDLQLPDTVADALRAARVPAELLTLEITETTVVTDPARAASVLHRLARLGVRLSLDDFGTGYTSMTHLRELPLHELKIDRTFVRGMLDNEKDGIIIRSVIELARQLELIVVAEGVETPSVHRALRDLGCPRGQGYLYCPPLPVDPLVRRLEGWAGHTAREPMADR